MPSAGRMRRRQSLPARGPRPRPGARRRRRGRAAGGTAASIERVVMAGPQQVSSTRRRWAVSWTNSGVSRIVSVRSSGRSTGTISRTRPGFGGQHQHALAEEGRLVDAVGDEQDGHAGLLPDPAQLLVEAVARDLVERAERLVHQQDLRVADQRAGDRDALALAAGQLVRIGVGAVLQAHQFQQFVRRAAALAAGAAADLQRQLDVLQRGAPGQQRRVLEHEADVAALARRLRRGRRARRCCRGWARSGRRRRAGRSTCRSPTGRAGSGTRPARRRGPGLACAVTLRRSVKKRTPMLRELIAGAGRCWHPWRQAFSRAAGVAFRMSSVITSSSLGVLGRELARAPAYR